VSKLTVAVVGAGRLGGFHAQKLAAMPDVSLAAVADPVAEQRNRVAAECRTTAVADYHELLNWVDAVVIAAPTCLHHGIGLTFLERGIHVLMEKPLCITAAHADDLLAAARQHGAVLQVGHVERFNPAFAAALPHLRHAKYVEMVRSGPFSFRSTDVGVVLDLMIHDLDLVLSMNRCPVRRVEAMGLSVLGDHEDVAHARLEFENGCVASLNACRVSYDAVRRMQAWSLRGFVGVDFATRSATIVSASDALLARDFHLDALGGEQLDHCKKHLMEEHLPRQQLSFEAVDALQLELADFVESIRTARSPRVSGQHGRDAVAVAEQILGEIERHAWDGGGDGRFGPLAVPRRSVIPAPHFDKAVETLPLRRREAG
jgi:predicted dehydrogenase